MILPTLFPDHDCLRFGIERTNDIVLIDLVNLASASMSSEARATTGG